MQVQHGGQLSKKANSSVDAVAIVIPVLNEATVMPRLLRLLQILGPAPAAIDGGSQDKTAALARQSGFARLIEHAVRGRAAAINRGVLEIRSPLVCVLHADTILPDDGIAVIRATMQDPRITLAGFLSLIVGAERVRWGITFHNWIKTWYAPLIFRPHLFFRGCRLLFGDQAMFFRRSDFPAVVGCDETLTVMEDADLCLRLFRSGRIRLVNRTVTTSDRRIAVWGRPKANLIYLYVGIRWALGPRHRIEHHYPDIRWARPSPSVR
jgi:GT2 family glycosyltransferase